MQPDNNSGLVEICREQRPLRFLLTLLAFSLLLIGCWAFIAPRLTYAIYAPARLTASDANLAALVKYAVANDKNVAWVGSSLTMALSERYFSIPGSYNLGLGGGSPVTGLRVLEKMQQLPKVVIIETNVLDRPVDQDLVARPWHVISNPIVAVVADFYRPLRLVPGAISFPSARVLREAKARRSSLLGEPSQYRGLNGPAREELDRLRRRPLNRALVQSNVAEINRIAALLESRGTRVLYVNMPYAPEFDELAYNARAKEAISGRERYDCARCIDLQHVLPIAELGWTDGQHVDERTSLLVIDAVERIVRSMMH